MKNPFEPLPLFVAAVTGAVLLPFAMAVNDEIGKYPNSEPIEEQAIIGAIVGILIQIVVRITGVS